MQGIMCFRLSMVDIALVARVCKLFIEGPEHITHLVHVWLGILPGLPPGPPYSHTAHYSRSATNLYIPKSTVLRKEPGLVAFEGRLKPINKAMTFLRQAL